MSQGEVHGGQQIFTSIKTMLKIQWNWKDLRKCNQYLKYYNYQQPHYHTSTTGTMLFLFHFYLLEDHMNCACGISWIESWDTAIKQFNSQ